MNLEIEDKNIKIHWKRSVTTNKYVLHNWHDIKMMGKIYKKKM